jgi:hypothetical protein
MRRAFPPHTIHLAPRRVSQAVQFSELSVTYVDFKTVPTVLLWPEVFLFHQPGYYAVSTEIDTPVWRMEHS